MPFLPRENNQRREKGQSLTSLAIRRRKEGTPMCGRILSIKSRGGYEIFGGP